MNENEKKLSFELQVERNKNGQLEEKIEQQKKEIQIIASILIVTLIILFFFLYANYKYEMEKIYQSTIFMAIAGAIFLFFYKIYPKISSMIFCSFFVLAAYKKGGFIDWSFGILFAILFIFNFFKKNDASM
ncbi:hypothetical protein GCAAIG_14330 [Candidatus Electronema halotolerans]